MKKSMLITGFVLVLSGCGDAMEGEDTNTVSFYMENEAKRIERVEWCKDNAQREIKYDNCANALSAKAKVSTRKLLKRDTYKSTF